MTSSPDDITDDPRRAAALLVAAADEEDSTARDALADLLAPYLSAGAQADDWAPVVRELGRSLRATHEALVAAEEQYATCEAELTIAYRMRERSIACVRRELESLRTVIGAVFGPEGLREFHLHLAIPTQAMPLVRVAGQVRTGLARLCGFGALRRGLALNPHLHQEPLGRALHTLASAMAAARSAEQALRNARTASERAREVHENRGHEAARALDGLLRRTAAIG